MRTSPNPTTSLFFLSAMIKSQVVLTIYTYRYIYIYMHYGEYRTLELSNLLNTNKVLSLSFSQTFPATDYVTKYSKYTSDHLERTPSLHFKSQNKNCIFALNIPEIL